MPIINMISNSSENFPEGAFCPYGKGTYNSEITDPKSERYHNETFVIVIYETHHGLCLFETERNGYHDSDFFMTIWNEDKQIPERIQFATTRGWCYPCFGSRPDASQEIWEKYNKWKREDNRRRSILYKWNQRKELNNLAYNMNMTRNDVNKLKKSLKEDDFNKVTRLLKTKKFRSKFRESLANQVREWLKGNSEYNTPLSKGQLEHLH